MLLLDLHQYLFVKTKWCNNYQLPAFHVINKYMNWRSEATVTKNDLIQHFTKNVDIESLQEF